MTLTIFTDGGSLNNPGQAAIAYLIYKDHELIEQESKRIGIASNNVAEYSALLSALVKVQKLFQEQMEKPEKIEVFSDSLLMVSQLKGVYKIKEPSLQDLATQVKEREKLLSVPVFYTHVRREKNTKADSLVKEILFGV